MDSRRSQFQMLAVVLGRFHLELHHSRFYWLPAAAVVALGLAAVAVAVDL
jgi:hypothetical protein